MNSELHGPVGLLAELTHRCPLGCPYCSNPVALEGRADELDAAEWGRVLREASALGMLHVHLSGGEPAARRDLERIVAAARDAGLYVNLITSGVGLSAARVQALAAAGLDHLQLSIQDSDPASADRIAGRAGAFAGKIAVAKATVEQGLPLTVNAVVHRANIERIGDIVALAMTLGASRVEIAHVQYHGWAHQNRSALLPSRRQAEQAVRLVERLRAQLRGSIVIDAVSPDYFARYPKPCLGGWGRRSLNVTPSGRVLPCHACEIIPGLEFWSVRDKALREIWEHSPAFLAFRGTDWMEEPCRSCARKEQDFGGCRCQAFLLAGNARATDPVCQYSPLRPLVDSIVSKPQEEGFSYRAPARSYRPAAYR